MHKSEIRQIGGRPTLYIDGAPTCAMAYTTYFEERSRCADFADAGYRLFFVNASFTTLPINSAVTGFSPFRVGVFEDIEKPDYTEFEREVYRILRACPDAILFPRIHVSMPRWWVEMHEEDCVPTPKGGYREALFSENFRRDGGELLARFIEHVKASDYAHSIGGWQICGGQTQEWLHHDLSGCLGKAAELPYRQWVKKHYGDKNATLPSPYDFTDDGTGENRHENAVRYALFCNEEVAKSIDHFAATVKEKTDFTQIVGTFYGYSFENNGTVLIGTHALRCLVDSRNVDFFSSPNGYTGNRGFGIDWADMMPVESIKRHGKLCFVECDIRTHLTCAIQEVRPGEYPNDMYKTENGKSVWAGPPTPALSLQALRKCFAHQAARGSAIWWFDMWGGWYADPCLMQELAAMRAIYEKEHCAKGVYPSPEVAFFADERAYARLFNRSPQLSGIYQTRTAMGNTGVPYDTYMAEDAETVLARYKAAVFVMPIASEAGQRAITLCKQMGIPYLCPTAESCGLTVEEIQEFYKQNGIHFYTESRDVVYVGNGYIGLHAATGGVKKLHLPRAYAVSPVFGAAQPTQMTSVIRFETEENATVLFSVSRTKGDKTNE